MATAPTFKIEKNVPQPSRSKYPFMDMEIGDSFLVPVGKGPTLRSMGSRLGKETGRRFTVRVMGDGARVWRVA